MTAFASFLHSFISYACLLICRVGVSIGFVDKSNCPLTTLQNELSNFKIGTTAHEQNIASNSLSDVNSMSRQ